MEVILKIVRSDKREIEIVAGEEGNGLFSRNYYLNTKKKAVFHRAYGYSTIRIPGTDIYITKEGRAYSSDCVTKYVYEYKEPFCSCFFMNVVNDSGKPVKEVERGKLTDLLLKGLIANINESDKLKHQLNYFKLKYNEEFDGISESSEDESSTD